MELLDLRESLETESAKVAITYLAELTSRLNKLFDEFIVNCRDHVVRTHIKKNTIPDKDFFNLIHVEIENNKITPLFYF